MPRPGGLLVRLVALSFVAACGLSCSGTKTLNTVQGKVLYQGQPLAGALVSFHPEDRQGDPAVGLTKADGTFELTTGEAQGTHPGTYTVTVMCQVPLETKAEGMAFGGEPETQDKLKGKYADRSTSQIKIEIKEGANQLEPIELK